MYWHYYIMSEKRQGHAQAIWPGILFSSTSHYLNYAHIWIAADSDGTKQSNIMCETSIWPKNSNYLHPITDEDKKRLWRG